MKFLAIVLLAGSALAQMVVGPVHPIAGPGGVGPNAGTGSPIGGGIWAPVFGSEGSICDMNSKAAQCMVKKPVSNCNSKRKECLKKNISVGGAPCPACDNTDYRGLYVPLLRLPRQGMNYYFYELI